MQDEIETEEIIKDIFQQGKTCFIPQYQFQSNHMDMVKLASPDEISSLPKTSWNIHQPGEDDVREEALSTGGLDLIFMPGLGFDNHGNRLGRGRGYYDAYLQRCLRLQGTKPYTIALAFKEQLCHQGTQSSRGWPSPLAHEEDRVSTGIQFLAAAFEDSIL
ncbi:5-formyltetrahydrofolate cyclo-ligase isoform X5 [Fukomys damarensis]|uniref:5-formyltetrahydrofolate cyclo-ligase isoform X5 n=1 Tax=Fukomys damarensis TaxID=885580 RepID=UPI001454F0F6|nr:5-formyltetrahydrofolate cyclo-ligase isoform X5 [Fukomys damarensis]